MSTPDHNKIFDVLAQQRQHQLLVDRVLKVVLPIAAFLLSVICANLNWPSTLGTFVILTVAFYAVGIRRLPLWHWLIIITIYVGVDHYFSFAQIDLSRLRFQWLTMLIFVGMVGMGRPYLDQWMFKKSV